MPPGLIEALPYVQICVQTCVSTHVHRHVDTRMYTPAARVSEYRSVCIDKCGLKGIDMRADVCAVCNLYIMFTHMPIDVPVHSGPTRTRHESAYVYTCLHTCLYTYLHIRLCTRAYTVFKHACTGRIGSRKQLAEKVWLVSLGCSGGVQRARGDHLHTIQRWLQGKPILRKIG